MTPSKTDFPDIFRPAEDFNRQDIKLCPYKIEDLMIRGTVKSASSIFIGAIVSTIETGDATSDLTILTVSADNSIVPLMYVPDTEYNRLILARDNSLDSLSGQVKATTTFAANSQIDVVYLVPGMIVSLCFANSTTVKPGVKVQSAGSGKVDAYATVNARIGHILGQFASEAAVHWGDVMITF